MTSEQSLEGQGGSGGQRGAGLLPLYQNAEPSPSVGTKPGGERKEEIITVQTVREPQVPEGEQKSWPAPWWTGVELLRSHPLPTETQHLSACLDETDVFIEQLQFSC